MWPVQVLAYVLGLAALVLTIKRSRYRNSIILGILSFMWLWTAIGFSLLFSGPVYAPAYVFALLYAIQGVLFLVNVVRPRLSFGFTIEPYSTVGLVFVAYATVGYPAVGYLLGHVYPRTPPFGLAPCPTTIYTFGLLLLTDEKVPRLFLALPLLWALGGVMPLSMGMLEDIGLVIAGILGTALILYRDRNRQD